MDAPATQPAEPRRVPLAQLIAREERRRRRRMALWWSSLAVLLLLAGGAWLWLRPRPVPLALRFRTGAVTRGDVLREVRATGHVEATTAVQVGAEISGRIVSVEADYNDRVRKGQVLARFDRAALDAQVAQARATLSAARAALEQARTDRDQAQRNLRRTGQLYAEKVSSVADLDAATSAARVAEQRVRAAQEQAAAQEAVHALALTNLSHGVVRSPIDGLVVSRNVDPGQAVASMLQTPVLFTVAADLRRMRVVAAVDEADVGEVKPGQRATFTVTGFPDRVFEGLVTEVRNAPVIVQDVVTYGAVVEVDNPELLLKPGMTATVRIRVAQVKGALRVPAAALRFTPPGEKETREGLWIVEAGALRRVPVKPSVSDGELTAVEGIAEGAQALVELSPEGRKAYGIGAH